MKKRFTDTLKVSFEVVRLIWTTSKPYTVYMIFLLLINGLIPITEAYIIKKIIDLLTASLQENITFNMIFFYIIIFIILTLFSRLIENQRLSIQIILGNLLNKNIQQRIAKKSINLPYKNFENPKFYDKLNITLKDASWRPLNAFFSLFGVLENLFILTSIMITISFLNPFIVIAMILFILPALIVEIKYSTWWWNLLYMETPESRKLLYYQNLMISDKDMKDIKLFGLKDHLLKRYKLLYEKLFNEQKEFIKKKYRHTFLMYLLSDIVLIIFYIYLTWQTFIKRLSIGDFSFYSTLYYRAVSSLHSMIKDIAGLYENNLFISEMLNFLRLPEEKNKIGSKNIPKKIKQGFEFRDVWFKYPETEQWILKGISFKIKKGNNIALVGENGAGKTTIVKLLCRLYEPDKGEILLDGIPVSDYKIDEYKQLIGIAFQDFAKFHFSARDNIAFGDIKRSIPIEEIKKTAKRVHIHEKIMSFPQKYNTMLGRWFNMGHELSHGEWQRVAIARALIKDSSVYILDEPTAALDAKAEFKVFQEFEKMVVGKIGLFISHRFANVKIANNIIVIEKGKIIQEGTHEELLRKIGKYREFYNFQAERYKD